MPTFSFDLRRGQEFDTPLNLFELENGIFRGMCSRSNISKTDIEKASLLAIQ
jgi:hypothetical protein